jgi:methyl-accepting chemotaxis protein
MEDLTKTLSTIDEIIAQHEEMKKVLAEINASLDEQHEIVQECLKK